MTLLLRAATLLQGGTDWTPQRGMDVLLRDGRIAAIGRDLAAPPEAARLNAAALLVLPAFVNAHTHSPEMLGRGLMPMADQPTWLAHAYGDGRDALTDEDIARAVRLCAAETVRGGAVAVTDHFRQIPPRAQAVRAAARAWAATGLSARIAINLRDRRDQAGKLIGVPDGDAPATRDILKLAEQVLTDGLPVKIGLGPSAPHRVTDALLLGLHALARESDSFLHLHLCESAQDAAACRAPYGTSAVAHLDRLGVLGPRTELAHAVHIDDTDIARIAANGATILHNPVANLRLGSGVAPIARALRAGVAVRLGSDGAGSNDTQSLLEAAKFALLAPRAAWPATEWLTPEQVLHMATADAVLAPGAPANLLAFDAEASAFLGAGADYAARIVLAAREGDIVHVIARGNFLLRDRRLCLT